MDELKSTAEADRRDKEALKVAEFEASLVARQKEREALRKERWIDNSSTISDEHREEIARLREMDQRQQQEEQQRAREESFRRRAAMEHDAAHSSSTGGSGSSLRSREPKQANLESPKMGEVRLSPCNYLHTCVCRACTACWRIVVSIRCVNRCDDPNNSNPVRSVTCPTWPSSTAKR